VPGVGTICTNIQVVPIFVSCATWENRMRKKDAKLIAMELRNWMNKKEYLIEDVNRAMVVLVNGMLGKGNTKPQERSCVLGHSTKPHAIKTVFIDDAEHCQS